ncbi:hypothetical protein [Streptomyces boncukensis]|uniref:Uncharacterized protein n=1 Tax=Streptomyces boncukensis TaxID=2711219 RepID=A0A6G4WWR2_9ACTN|nr:hypothetical protein [Streptomyces boncukensis]NGO69302.1 hypothetical protein [Streptomyces boncukensis]
MNTTTAAAQADVTVATIRRWCRYGAVTATKHAGRWAIDAASLAHRIALSKLRTRKPRPVVYSVETMTAIGGSEWQRYGKHRVYLNDWAELAGLEITRYNSGNIQFALWQGERISNAQASKILSSIDKIWFDAATGKIHCRYGWSESRVASRDEVWNAITSGVRTAIDAL